MDSSFEFEKTSESEERLEIKELRQQNKELREHNTRYLVLLEDLKARLSKANYDLENLRQDCLRTEARLKLVIDSSPQIDSEALIIRYRKVILSLKEKIKASEGKENSDPLNDALSGLKFELLKQGS